MTNPISIPAALRRCITGCDGRHLGVDDAVAECSAFTEIGTAAQMNLGAHSTAVQAGRHAHPTEGVYGYVNVAFTDSEGWGDLSFEPDQARRLRDLLTTALDHLDQHAATDRVVLASWARA